MTQIIKKQTTSSEKPLPKLLTRNFMLLFFGHLFFGFSFWPYVLLPVFLQDLGSDLTGIGIIMGIASVAGILIRPWIGVALERVGRRRCLLIGGLIFFTAHVFYLSIERIGWTIYFIRLIHGFGIGILFSTFFAFAADISPDSRRTEGIALFGVAGHLSGALGIPLGEQIIAIWGYNGLFKACAFFTILFTLISFFIKESTHEKGNALFDVRRFVKSTFLAHNRIPLCTTGLFALGLTSYMVFLKPYAHSVGLGVSTFFLTYSFTAVFVRLVGGKWPDRFGLMQVLYPAFFSQALGIILLALWPTAITLLLAGIFCGIGHGFIFPILSVLLINRAPDTERGARMTLFTLFFEIGIFIGSPLLGFVANAQGYQIMFFLSSMIVLTSVAAFVFLDRPAALVPALEVEEIPHT